MKRTPKVLAALLITALAVPIGLAASGVASAHHVEGGCARPGVWEVDNSESNTAATFTTNRHGNTVFELPAGGTTEVVYAGTSISISTTWANGVGPVFNTLTGDCIPECSWNPGNGARFKASDYDCFDASVAPVCGSVSGLVTGGVVDKPTWTYDVWFSETAPANGEDGMPGSWSTPGEDTGTYLINWWVSGTENDALIGSGVPTYQSPLTVVVSSDCIPPQPEPESETTWDELGEPECGVTEQTQTGTIRNYEWFLNAETQQWVRVEVSAFPTSRVVPVENPTECPVPNANVVCTSTGPDYVSWQLTNTGEVAITSPVELAPGESTVIESLRNEQGNVSVEVSFADGTSGTFEGSGEGCVFTPPPTTEPPVTEPPVTDPPSTEPPVTEPPTTTTPPVGRPPIPTTTPPAFTGTLPETL